MEFRILGPLEVVEHDRMLVLRRGRQRLPTAATR